MQSIPIATGLFLCDQLIVEHRTMKVSPFGIFTRLNAEGFPHTARPFSVFASLTDGLGRGLLRATAHRLDNLELVYQYENWYDFSDPLTGGAISPSH